LLYSLLDHGDAVGQRTGGHLDESEPEVAEDLFVEPLRRCRVTISSMKARSCRGQGTRRLSVRER
jgi:hypothetical protein